MRTLYVNLEESKKIKLIQYIKLNFKSLSMNYLYKALRNKDIRVNNIKVNSNIDLKNNDKIDIYITDKILYNLPNNIDIIYEDENILAIFKPQGILSNLEDIIDKNPEPTLENLVLNYYKDAKICHRLDRNTAGIILFTKNDSAYKAMLQAFKHDNINKEYIAYVYNSNFKKEQDLLNNFIVIDKQNSFAKVYTKNVLNSKKITTEYFVLSKNTSRNYAIVKVIIHTGKTHQIRAQFKELGHPIIGDTKYTSNEINKKFKLFKQLLFAVKYSFNFEKNSYLYYLNKVKIALNENYYMNKL